MMSRNKPIPEEVARVVSRSLENVFPVEAACIWGLKKLFGPSLDEIGKSLAQFVKINLERLFESYKRKIRPD